MHLRKQDTGLNGRKISLKKSLFSLVEGMEDNMN